MRIKDVNARQIFDSRGVPTLEVRVELADGSRGIGSAPSGASTGIHEAHELRDCGAAYFGKGVSCAVENVNTYIRAAIIGADASEQAEIDRRMLKADAGADKSRLGGNALIATSWAVADAAAKAKGVELYRWIGGIQALNLPCPMFNVMNGGGHADNNLEIQEFMFVPIGADDFHDAMRMGVECCHALKKLLREAGLSTAVGDEGGFAPNLKGDEEALEWMLRAVEAAGWRAGEDVYFALDAAAAQWQDGDEYCQLKSGRRFQRDELMEYYGALAARFPILSLEDPMGEEDFDGFRQLTEAMGDERMIVGDDLFTTNPQRLQKGVEMGAGNAILIKPNQIGTLTETLHTVHLARQNGYRVIVSHRSGETLSSAIADLAVAVNAEYIKAGAPVRGERIAKYNRLLEIENQMK